MGDENDGGGLRTVNVQQKVLHLGRVRASSAPKGSSRRSTRGRARARASDALGHAAGNLRGRHSGVGEAHEVEKFGHAFLGLAATHAAGQTECDVLRGIGRHGRRRGPEGDSGGIVMARMIWPSSVMEPAVGS